MNLNKLLEMHPRVIDHSFFPQIDLGWEHLVEEFIEEIDEAAKQFKDGSVYVTDIKEKFGGMRIYVEYDLPDQEILEFEKIVSKYEHLSLKTCTVCSSEEKQMHKRRGYWDIVICEECFDKR
jgi:hypothetical protein